MKHHAQARHATTVPVVKASPRTNEHLFEIRGSDIQGKGAFALVDIPKGTRLIEYTGEKISNDESDRRYDDDTMTRHHTFLFTVSSRTIVDGAVGGNDSIYINHSCEPNCESVIVRGRIWIETIKKVKAGEELVYDYQYEDYDDYTMTDYVFYACRCGSKKCRGTIVKVPPRKRIKPKRAPKKKA